jgi:hypothetical protein
MYKNYSSKIDKTVHRHVLKSALGQHEILRARSVNHKKCNITDI